MWKKIAAGIATAVVAVGTWVGATAAKRNDKAPPTVVLTAPLPNIVVPDDVLIRAEITDNVGVVRLVILIGNAVAYDVQKPPAKKAIWEVHWTPTYQDAEYQQSIVAVAYDAAGNQRATPALTVMVPAILKINSDGMPPTYTCNVPYNGVAFATGGTLPYRWDLASGAMPEWMTMTTAFDTKSAIFSGIPPVNCGNATYEILSKTIRPSLGRK